MDTVKAAELEKLLQGKSIGTWQVLSLKNHGKSAAVFKATDGKETVALKIFDDELIEKYGDKTQIKRIERELTLVGKSHPNMVRILDGGFDKITNNHFIVMEFLDGPNLKECLNQVPTDNIPILIEQLANCCQFLECMSLAHRDIKPENIVILDDFTRLVLLDFGVLRPVGEPGLTDTDGIQPFVGTLQYSSPEFLLRKEEDTKQGWRALTFYQIGGVLHDLIMRKSLFSDQSQPYARLVNAVQFDTPTIQNTAVPSYLVETARAALIKDPHLRTSMINWDSFSAPKDQSASLSAIKERVTNRTAIIQATPSALAERSGSIELLETVIASLKVQVRAVRSANSASIPPLNVTREGDALLVRFRRSAAQGLPEGLILKLDVRVLDADAGAVEVNATAAIGDSISGLTLKAVSVFRGLFTSDALSAATENCIYVSLDQAQQLDSKGGAKPLQLGELTISGE